MFTCISVGNCWNCLMMFVATVVGSTEWFESVISLSISLSISQLKQSNQKFLRQYEFICVIVLDLSPYLTLSNCLLIGLLPAVNKNYCDFTRHFHRAISTTLLSPSHYFIIVVRTQQPKMLKNYIIAHNPNMYINS